MLKPVWNDRSLSFSSKIRLISSLIKSIFLYACESWSLTAELKKKNAIHGNEVLPQDTTHFIQRPCYQRRNTCQDPACIRTTRRPPDHRKETCLRSSGLAKTILQGTVKGGWRQGKQKKRWKDNIRDWTGPEFAKSQRAVENREKWTKLVVNSSPNDTPRLRERWRWKWS